MEAQNGARSESKTNHDLVLSEKYKQILESVAGGPEQDQRDAAMQLASHLREVSNGGVTVEHAVRKSVEKAVAYHSWTFLAALFGETETSEIGQQVIDSALSEVDDSSMPVFLDALFKYLQHSNGRFDASHAKGLFRCLTQTESGNRARVIKMLLEEMYKKLQTWINYEHQWISFFDFAGICCKSLDSENQDTFIRSLLADTEGSMICQFMAVYLAADTNKWDLAGEISKLTQLQFLPGTIDSIVFGNAALDHAFHFAASMLQNSLDRNSTNFIGVSKMQNYMASLFASEKSLEILTQCLEICRNGRLYGAGALFAAWASDLKKAKEMALCERVERGVAALLKVLTNVSLTCSPCYCFMLEITSQLEGDCKQKVVSHILEWAADRCYDSGARVVVKKLIGVCKDKSVLEGEVLFQILENCMSGLFCTFVNKDPVDLSRVVVQVHGPVFFAVATMLAHYGAAVGQSRARGRHASSRRGTRTLNSFTIMLRKCIEAGLSTQHSQTPAVSRLHPFASSSPLAAAAASGNLELVQLLYRAGATTDSDLYKLAQDPRLTAALDRRQQQGVLDYLLLKASNPRSLLDLCRLTVSRQIGCRADRKHRALSLGLPRHLVELVLFYDVLF